MTAPTRAQIEALIGAYDRASPFRTADYHHEDCDCLRCCVDRLRASLAEPQPAPVEPVADDTIRQIVRGVWGHCEALEDEAYAKLEKPDMTDHERGFWRGQKKTAKDIRRSTEMPRATQTTPPEDVGALIAAAHGLSFGEDWNNGTQAKTHGHRDRLLTAIAKIMGDRASPQAQRAALAKQGGA